MGSVLLILLVLTARWGSSPESHTTAPATALAATQSGPPPSPWYVRNTINPVDDTRTAIIQQGSRETGSIMIRCGKKLDAYFNTPGDRSLDTDVSRTQRIRVRYGTNPPIRQSWAVADSFDALFAPQPSTFLRALSTGGQVVIEYATDGLVSTRTFQGADLDKVLQQNCPVYTAKR